MLLHRLIGLAWSGTSPNGCVTWQCKRTASSGSCVQVKWWGKAYRSPTAHWLAAPSKFALVLYNIVACVNNVSPAQLPAPDDFTMSVANIEDDVTRSICSVALELQDEFKNVKLTFSRSKSMIVSNRKGLANRVRRILEVNDLHIPEADAARGTRALLMRPAEAGDDARSVPRGQTSGKKSKCWQRKSQSGQAPHHWLLAFNYLRSGAVCVVCLLHRFETHSKQNSCMFGCGWTSGLLRHSCGDRNGKATQPCHPSALLHFLLVVPLWG